MKKKNLLLLSLVSLSLVGCFDKTSDSNKTSANSNSVVNSDKTSVSTKPSTTSKDTTTDKGSSTKSDTATDTTSSDKEEDIYTQTKWPLEIAKAMYKKLDKRFVPYVDLKPTKENRLSYSWSLNSSTFTIMSDYLQAPSASMLQEAKTTYETAGWTATTTDDSFTATNQEQDLTVTLAYVDEVLTFAIKFDEKFDETKASAWDDELLEQLNKTFGNHGADIPYVYLGTINPELNKSTNDADYEIDGGKWDKKDDSVTSILDLFKNAFEKANASITGDNKWVVAKENENYNDSDYIATRTLDDGCKFKIKLSSYQVSQNETRAYLTISYYPTFTPSSSTAWPSDVTEYFNNNFDGHSIPYFYIGSDNITPYQWTESQNEKTYYGDAYTWNDQILTLAENAVNAENANLADEYKWIKTVKEEYDGTTYYSFKRSYEDGCALSFSIKNNGDYGYSKAVLKIKYSPKYTVPTGAKWSDEILAQFQQYLGTQDIPYIYLGTEDVKASWKAQDKILTVEGSQYYASLLTGATSAFTSALGWNGQVETITEQNYGSSFSYKKFVATKTINTETDTKLKVEVEGSMHGNYYDEGTDGNCVLKIYLSEPFTPPTGENASWEKYTYQNQKVSEIITDKLDGHTIPFVYLNASDVTTYFSQGDKALYITGSIWDDAVLSHAKTQFEAATGWTDITVDDTNKEFTAKCALDDGCKMSVLIHKNNQGYIEYKTTIDFAFKPMTDWSDDAKTIMQGVLNGHVLPVVQSGSATPDVYTYSDTVIISNNNWKEGLLEETSTSLTADGWTCFVDNEVYQTYYQRLNVFREFDDGILYFFVANTSYGFYLEASFLTKPTNPTRTSWNDAEKANLDDITENQTDALIPFLYMGEGAYVVGGNKKIYGSSLPTYSVVKYYETLKALGYTDFHLYFTQGNTVEFSASHTDSNGNVITINVFSQFEMDYTTYQYCYELALEVTYTKASTSEAE